MAANESILDVLEKSKGYKVALLTTFNFEVAFFERFILRALMKNSIRRTCIFVDADQLRYSMQDASSNLFGKEYFVAPVPINGSFHPKVILLLGENRAKVIVSSANVKTSGYLLNNEIFNVIEYDESYTRYGHIIQDVVDLFKELYSLAPIQDEELLAYLNGFTAIKTGPDESVGFISNLQEPIISQLSKFIDEQILQMKIAVPFYDQELSALKELQSEFGCNDVRLYVQNERTTFPVEYNQENRIVPQSSITRFEHIKTNNNKLFYHGKVFELMSANHSYIMYGSPNCTMAALNKTYKNGGNVECALLIKSDANSNKEFFENFIAENSKPLVKGFFTNVYDSSRNFVFQYGLLKDDVVDLHIRSNSFNASIEFFYNTVKLQHHYDGIEIIVEVPTALLVTESCIFDISVKSEEIEEIINCWFMDLRAINRFRNYELITNFGDYENIEDSKKRTEYLEKLFEALYGNGIELEYGKALAQLKAKKAEKEGEGEEMDPGGFIIEEDISDHFITREPMFVAAYSHSLPIARMFYATFMKKNKTLPLKTNYRGVRIYEENEIPDEIEPRQATPAEKRFARTVKRHINRNLLSADVDALPYDYYKNLLGVLFQIIQKEVYDEKVKGFLEIEYVLEVKLKYMNILLDKFLASEMNEEEKDLLIRFALQIITECIYHDYSVQTEARKLLSKIDYHFHIRDTFDLYYEDLDLETINISNAEKDRMLDEIDDLFGYKTKAELQRYFEQAYFNSVKMTETGNVYMIEIKLFGKSAPFDLACKHLDVLLRHFDGYNKQPKKILIKYIESKTKIITFIVKAVKLHVNSVVREQLSNGKIVQYKCIRRDGSWKPQFFK